MVFVTFSSLYSFEDYEIPRFEIPHFDKGVHFGFYFIAAILGILSFQGRIEERIFPKKMAFLVVLGLIAFGILIEFIQQEYTASRMGDSYDAMANGLGAIMGSFVLRFLFFSKKGLN